MNLLKKVLKEILPEIKVDENLKMVEIKRNLIGSNISEAFYIFKGYEVKVSY